MFDEGVRSARQWRAVWMGQGARVRPPPHTHDPHTPPHPPPHTPTPTPPPTHPPPPTPHTPTTTTTRYPDLPLSSMPAGASPDEVLSANVFSDGKAMLGILHSLCPNECKYTPSASPKQNWASALASAHTALGVPILVDAPHMVKGGGFWEDPGSLLLVM